MVLGLTVSLIMGICWWNLLVYFGFKSEKIYNFINKNGQLRKEPGNEARKLMVVLVVCFMVYLVLSDLLVFRFTPIGFPIVLMVNTLLLLWLLLYNRVIINGWLLTRAKPYVLDLSKAMSPKTLAAFAHASFIYGFLVGLMTAMAAAAVYTLIANFMM